MVDIDHTSQATFVATDPLSEPVFCCDKQSVLVAHPNIRNGGVKDQITTFLAKLSTNEPLFLLLDSSTENIKASISSSYYIIEVERNVDDGFECRYFIHSREKVVAESGEAPTVQSRGAVRSSYHVTASSTPQVHREDVYVEVHVKDLFRRNPAASHINNCFMLVGCRFHQTYVGTLHKRVHVFKNFRLGKIWRENEKPREVTGEWLKGGHGNDWGT